MNGRQSSAKNGNGLWKQRLFKFLIYFVIFFIVNLAVNAMFKEELHIATAFSVALGVSGGLVFLAPALKK